MRRPANQHTAVCWPVIGALLVGRVVIAAVDAAAAPPPPAADKPAAALQIPATGQRTTLHAVVDRYVAALEAGDEPRWPLVVQRLAWILATHDDPRIRDGDAALRLTEGLFRAGIPRSRSMLELLAAASAAAGRFDEAVRHQTAALSLASRQPAADVSLQRARLDAYRRHTPAAEPPLCPFQPRPDPRLTHEQQRLAHVLHLLGLVLLGDGFRDEAGSAWLAALQYVPDHPGANLSLGWLRWLQQRPPEAAAHWMVAWEAGCREPAVALQLALLFRQWNRADQAIVWLTRALDERPDWPEAANELAWFLATHPEEQFRDGRRAVDLAQRLAEQSQYRQPAVLDTLAAAWAESGHFDRAAQIMQQAVALLEAAPQADQPPQSLKLEQYRDRLRLYRRGRPFREPPPAPPDAAQQALLEGLQARLAGRQLQAVEAMWEAVRRQPHWHQAANELAWWLATHHDAQYRNGHMALRIAEELSAQHPEEPTVLDTLAAACAELGRFEAAARWQRRAMARLPAGDPRRGAFACRQVLYEAGWPFRETAAQPAEAPRWLQLGLERRRRGEYFLAAACLREAHRHDPHHPGIANELAWLLATAPDDSLRDGAAALRLAQQLAYATDVPHPPVLDTLAAACAELGRFDEAVRHAQAAIAQLDQRPIDGDPAAAALRRKAYEHRLAGYRQGRPYREGSEGNISAGRSRPSAEQPMSPSK